MPKSTAPSFIEIPKGMVGKMKKAAWLLVLTLGFLALSGCRNTHSGETPLTSSYYAELGYLKYVNEDYGYEVHYPDIFTDEDDYTNGIVLTSAEVKLSVFAKDNPENLTLEESYETALANFSNPAGGGIVKNVYSFYYEGEDADGFYYMMYYYDTFFGFKLTFPKGARADYEDTVEKIEKNFLIYQEADKR